MRNLNSFVQQLIKAVKNYKLSRKPSEETEEFIDLAYKFLILAQEETGPIVLVINEDKIMHNSSILFEDPKRITSLPLFLYRNGIRSFTFLEGIMKEEFAEFIELLSKKEYTSNLGLVEDLWGRKFENIIYHAVEKSDTGYDSIKIQEIVEERKRLTAKELSIFPVATEKGSLTALEDTASAYAPKVKINRKNSPNLLLKSIRDILEFERSPKKRMQVLNLFKSSVLKFINSGGISFLLRSKGLLESLIDKEKEQLTRKTLYEIYDLLSTKSAEELYLYALTSSEDKKLKKDALSLLVFMGVEIVDDLLNILEITVDEELRKAIISLLEGIFSYHKDVLAHNLESVSGNNLQVLLSIIERSKDTYYIPYLEPFLSRRGYRKAKKVFFHILPRAEVIKYIDDQDYTLRLLALEELKELWGEDEFNVVANRIKSKDFWYYPEEERRNLLNLLSTLNIPETIEIFRDILKKRHFANQDFYKTKKLAIEALSKIKSEEAYSIISHYKNKKYLKEVVERSLKEYERH